MYRNVKWVGVPYGPFLKRPFAGCHAGVLGHAATRAAVHVAGVADAAAVVLLPAAAPHMPPRLPPPTSPEMVETGKLLGGYQAIAGAIDTHKHPLKPKSLPFKGRAWQRDR